MCFEKSSIENWVYPCSRNFLFRAVVCCCQDDATDVERGVVGDRYHTHAERIERANALTMNGEPPGDQSCVMKAIPLTDRVSNLSVEALPSATGETSTQSTCVGAMHGKNENIFGGTSGLEADTTKGKIYLSGSDGRSSSLQRKSPQSTPGENLVDRVGSSAVVSTYLPSADVLESGRESNTSTPSITTTGEAPVQPGKSRPCRRAKGRNLNVDYAGGKHDLRRHASSLSFNCPVCQKNFPAFVSTDHVLYSLAPQCED